MPELGKVSRSNVHFWLILFVLILCIIASVMGEFIPFCSWNFRIVKVLEIHSSPAFVTIFLCILAFYSLGHPPSVSLCITVDLIGFFMLFTVAILQLTTKFTPTYETEFLVPKDCCFSLVGILNLFSALLILLDMVLFIKTDGHVELAANRPQNLGDNLLDGFQDPHFWLKFTILIMSVICTLYTVLLPNQCKWDTNWFNILEMHGAPTFAIICLCLLTIYLFGEYPGAMLGLSFDIVGFIIFISIGSIQMFISFYMAYNGGSCHFSIASIFNLIITVLLLIDAILYIVVEVSMGIEDESRRLE